MRWHQWLLLVVGVVIGTVLTLVVPRYLLENVLTGAFLTPDLDYPAFLDGAFQPATFTLWLLNIAVLLGWIGFTWSRRPASSRRIRQSRSLWMILFVFLILAGLLLFVAFTALGLSALAGGPGGAFPISPIGGLVLTALAVLNPLVLFWLPSLFATPRNFRFVPPLAVTVLGGR
jgi:hypothetical protein